jgi:hypothetical protein
MAVTEAYMSERTAHGMVVLIAIVALLLLACVIDEDLRIHSDGSGTYRVRITIPKELGEGFGDLRKEAEKNGFRVVQEGETEKERFLVIRKDFDDVTALNDAQTHFELTITEVGFLRREYRLRASLEAIGFGGFKRHLTVAMPGSVSSTTGGETHGSRVEWDGSAGGSIDIVSSGFYLPLRRGQSAAMVAVILAGLLLFIAVRLRRRQSPAATPCLTCNSPVPGNARFCQVCGANTPAAEV